MKAKAADTWAYGELGLYHPGLFLSDSFAGIPWEVDLASPVGVGALDYPFAAQPVPGGLARTLRIATFQHETAHYVQDLCLGASLAADQLTDEAGDAILQSLAILAHSGGVSLPVRQQDLPRFHNRNAAAMLSRAHQHHKAGRKLVGDQPMNPEKSQLWQIPAVGQISGRDNPIATLSPRFLLEGIAAVQTCKALVERATSGELEYLASNKHELPILPEELSSTYSTARRLFDLCLGPLMGTTQQYADDWPHGYWQSARAYADAGFLFLADIALHVPPPGLMAHLIEAGDHAQEDFDPAIRFCRAIESLVLHGGFPTDNISGDDFYRLVFDSFAHDPDLHWPTLKTTNDAWIRFTGGRKLAFRLTSDGYRFRLLVTRDKRPSTGIVMQNPVTACREQAIPIFHRTPTGWKVIQHAGSVLFPWEGGDLDAYGAFGRPFVPWQDQEGVTVHDAIEATTQYAPQLERELIHRSLFVTFQDAVLEEDHYSCPFASRGCRVAVPGCSAITEPALIPTAGCSLRDFLTRHRVVVENLHWNKEIKRG